MHKNTHTPLKRLRSPSTSNLHFRESVISQLFKKFNWLEHRNMVTDHWSVMAPPLTLFYCFAGLKAPFQALTLHIWPLIIISALSLFFISFKTQNNPHTLIKWGVMYPKKINLLFWWGLPLSFTSKWTPFPHNENNCKHLFIISGQARCFPDKDLLI